MTNNTQTEAETIAELDAVSGLFSHWEAADARSTDACYETLASIFIAAPSYEASDEKRRLLEQRVRKHPDVWRSRRFDMAKKTAVELMLTMLFGIKERRGAKSNWGYVVKAANKLADEGELPRTRDAFIARFKDIGMEGARKIASGEPERFDFATLDEFVTSDWVIELPELPPDDAVFPNDVAVIVVKMVEQEQGPPKAIHLGYVPHDRVIERAARALLHDLKAEREKVAEQWVRASGDPALLVPKKDRVDLGRTHFHDEDDRDEFLREKRSRGRAPKGKKAAKKGVWESKPTGQSLPLNRKGEIDSSGMAAGKKAFEPTE